MEIDLKGGIRIKINQKASTASVTKSPKATGHIFIPKFAEYENNLYW